MKIYLRGILFDDIGMKEGFKIGRLIHHVIARSLPGWCLGGDAAIS